MLPGGRRVLGIALWTVVLVERVFNESEHVI
jgi:hypothetical protein